MACTVVDVPSDTPPENGEDPTNGDEDPQPPEQIGGLPLNAIALVVILVALWGLSQA